MCTVQFKAVCDGISCGGVRIRVEGDEISLDPSNHESWISWSF